MKFNPSNGSIAWSAALCCATVSPTAAAAPPTITLAPLSSVRTVPRNNGAVPPVLSPAGASIIVACDTTHQRVLVVNQPANRIDVIGIANPALPVVQAAVGMTGYGPFPTSVTVHGNLIAVASQGTTVADPGKVAFFDENFQPLATVTVGALPDMITFSPNGRYLLVSNEGEPSDPLYGSGVIDPEGSISIVDVTAAYQLHTVGFAGFNDQAAGLRAQGVHLNGPGATGSQDLEPEWITVSQDSKTAWATLQENNAIAEIDLRSLSVTRITGLVFKDHSRPENAFDASDRDGIIYIRPWPVFGLYQPDSIEAVRIAGADYLVIANEGAGRDVETARVGSLTLDPSPSLTRLI